MSTNTRKWVCCVCSAGDCRSETDSKGSPLKKPDGCLYPSAKHDVDWHLVEDPPPQPAPPKTLADVPEGMLCSCPDLGYQTSRYWQIDGRKFFVNTDKCVGVTGRPMKGITVAEVLGRVVITYEGAPDPRDETIVELRTQIAANVHDVATQASRLNVRQGKIDRLQAENEVLLAAAEKQADVITTLRATVDTLKGRAANVVKLLTAQPPQIKEPTDSESD